MIQLLLSFNFADIIALWKDFVNGFAFLALHTELSIVKNNRLLLYKEDSGILEYPTILI